MNTNSKHDVYEGTKLSTAILVAITLIIIITKVSMLIDFKAFIYCRWLVIVMCIYELYISVSVIVCIQLKLRGKKGCNKLINHLVFPFAVDDFFAVDSLQLYIVLACINIIAAVTTILLTIFGVF